MEPEPQAPPEPQFQLRARLVLATGLVLVGVWIIRDFLPAIAWAVVLAIALWPSYARLLRVFPGGRIVAPLLLTLAVGVVVTAPLVLLGVAIAEEARVVVDLIASARRHGIAVPGWVVQLPLIGNTIADWWRANLSDPVMAEELFGHLSRMVAGWAREYGGAIVNRLLILLFTLLTLFFLFRDGTRITDQLRALSDRVIGTRGEQIARHMIAAVHGTVNGLVLVGFGEGIVLGFIYFAVGLPYPAMVGAVTGVLAVIPFGAPLVYWIAVVYLLGIGRVIDAIVIAIVGSVVVFVADHFIRPVLIGGAARLPFMWVLFGLLGGLETTGLIGLFLGPAIMAALAALWREWTEAPEPALQAAADQGSRASPSASPARPPP
jgi:predicted PurR-regulated permease PerM